MKTTAIPASFWRLSRSPAAWKVAPFTYDASNGPIYQAACAASGFWPHGCRDDGTDSARLFQKFTFGRLAASARAQRLALRRAA